YPDIAPPTVQVMATYPGANATTVLESVVIPIEEKINGVEGMTYMTSTASNNGMAQITVYFDQNYDPDIAAVNVQNRVALANPLLPAEVKQTGVSTKKQQTDALMYLNFYSTNPDLGEVDLSNYMQINIVPDLQRINGVGDVGVYSSKTYSMRIWLKPDKMALYNIDPSDVTNAISSQSQEAAAGVIGQNTGQAFSYTITYPGRYNEEQQYENIIIKALGNGDYLRLGDVADIELGGQNYQVTSRTDAKYPTVSMSINQTKGSNAQEVIKEIRAHLAEFEKDFPKGYHISVTYDTNEFLDASIEKVVHTLIEAFILVFIVVFVFLQDLRSTLIPAIAVPVSIIGTFFFLNIFGYSINLLTLFALVLAIGIVVDDAIVVVEAVHAKIDQGEQNVRKGTIEAMDEIAGAIVSITLVMAAVFIPVTFIQGPTGVFYRQFGVTLMTAIVISAVNALTLSPALCALFLKPHNEDEKIGFFKRFGVGFNAAFDAVLKRYTKALHIFHNLKFLTPLILILAVVGIIWSSSRLSKGFVPDEDRSVIFANIELPPAATLDRTAAVNKELAEKVLQIPGVNTISTVGGYSIINGQGENYGIGFIKLDDWGQRKEVEKSVKAITGKLFGIASTIKDANIIFFSPPSVPGYSASGGFEFSLLDRSGGSFNDLSKETQNLLMALNQRPEIMYANGAFRTDYPQYQLDINIPVALEAGVNINSIFRTLQGYIGSIYAADFTRFGKQYRVYIQAGPEDRASLEDLNKLYVKTNSGDMAPINQFIKMKRVYGPQSVNRFNMYNSSKIVGAPAAGYSTGDALTAIQQEVAKMPQEYGIGYSGLTREEVTAGNQTTMIFILVVIFTYFLLAAQYESYLLPFSILLSVPLGIFGAYFTTELAGLENNIYLQIALIMLVGLLAKNAILIVEFAVQRRRHGETIFDAAIDGAKARLRPILMTSFAFILGLMPLAFANGVGAVGNRSIGTGAVGGLLIGTLTAIFVIPTLFVFFQWLQEKLVGTPEFDQPTKEL
ncbi:MAG: efflux RND transporter permease subunit, partial [Chitinophagales bacterium]|nr:efflux RND transporter permease subunit [Chitinophagales bacterium]